MAINRVTRKLERLELLHLRQLVADLHDQLERANDTIEFWNDYAMQLQEMQLDPEFATHRAIGLTKTGETLVVALS